MNADIFKQEKLSQHMYKWKMYVLSSLKIEACFVIELGLYFPISF